MKLISIVEYICNGNIIRISIQIEIENAIMNKNTTQFQLAYNSFLFEVKNLLKIETCSLNKGA